jgi:hypothetical protein
MFTNAFVIPTNFKITHSKTCKNEKFRKISSNAGPAKEQRESKSDQLKVRMEGL